jgi:methionyl-tRNA formyltransferase
MKILYLGPERPHLVDHIRSFGDVVIQTEEILNPRPDLSDGVDLIVSYGYRHILHRKLISQFPDRIVNLHISLLPWNRGADPNVWSFLEDTPKGVTIHLIDSGVDTGPILAQTELRFKNTETLRTSYDALSRAIEQLFIAHWRAIRIGDLAARPQVGGGTSHRSADIEPYRKYLTHGWDTPIADLVGLAVKEAGRLVHAH